jgi:hypothetical protein
MLALALVLAASPPHTALDRLAAMAGGWTATEGGKDSPAHFEPIANGTAVEQKSGYVAVFHLDGDALLATVFVDDGFSVRLRAAGKGLSDNRLVFEVDGFSNKAAAANGVPERLEVEWKDSGHVVQRWRWKPKSGEAFTFEVTLTRNPR